MKYIKPETRKSGGIAFVKVPSGFYISKELYKENGKPKADVSQAGAIAIGKGMSGKKLSFRLPTSAEWMNVRRYFQKIDESRGINYLDGDSLERDMLIGNCEYTCSVVDFRGGYPFYPEEKVLPQLIRNACFIKYPGSGETFPIDWHEPENNRKEFEWLKWVPGSHHVYKIKEWDDKWGFPSKVDRNDSDHVYDEYHQADVCVFANRLRAVTFKDHLLEEHVFEMNDFFKKTFLEMNRYHTKISMHPSDSSDVHSFRLVAEPK
jgi:hypothetical protein